MAEGPPENITDATLEGPEAPYWKTVTLNFTCHEGYLTTGGEKWTNVTFNGTDWVLGDHDFACWKSNVEFSLLFTFVVVTFIFVV